MGTIEGQFTWGGGLGYAGFGFGRSIPRARVGFGMELGCYYLGIPKIELHYDGFLETTTIQEQIPTIQRNLSGYRYLPALQFVLTYAIRR